MAEIVLLSEYVLLVALGQLLVALGSECTGHQLRCNDGEGCYSDEQRCNGKHDCSDGTDELLCTIEDCPSDGRIKFCHTSQKCIDVWITLCECSPGRCRIDETCCSDGSGCYTQDQKCDGTYHCKNGADEDICVSSSGPQGIGALTVGKAVISIIVVLAIITVVVAIILYCRYRQTRRIPNLGERYYDPELETTLHETPQQSHRDTESQISKQQESSPGYTSVDIAKEPPPAYDKIVDNSHSNSASLMLQSEERR